MKPKLITSILGLVITAQTWAQTILPSFALADDFGGKTVDNLTQFVPTTKDFTLEVNAKSGTPISIAFGEVNYTPTANGLVRFVQQNGKIYVFENSTYTTTLTPNYKYTVKGDNILRNPSFEQVDEKLAEGRWKATEWETWNGGTPTWGGDVGYVNVRENPNYCSDGKKSIVLHSSSRWLCQQLTKGAIEADANYLLTYDYWTSEGAGNGGITYRLQLGSAMAGNDILDMQGHTTINTNTKQSFSTILTAPSILPENIYLSFYRSESKVDWMDNVKLQKIEPSAKGLQGVTTATYTTGAFAPKNMSLPEGVNIDMTSYITNPNFDDNLNEWTLTANTQSKISTGDKGNGFIAANQNHWQLWQAGGALTGKAYQTITGLPNGKYVIGADIVTTSFGGKITLYANYGNTTVASNAAKRYTVNGIVIDGKLEMGLNFETTGGMTIDFDTFTLLYQGMDKDAYHEVLALRVKEARSVLNNLEAGFDSKDITAAIENAEKISEEANAEDIIAAYAALNKALDDYTKYVAEREAESNNKQLFNEFVTAAKTERSSKDYPGTTDFDVAISRAEIYLENLEKDYSANIAKYQSEKDALSKAREAYYNSQFTIKPSKQTVSYVDTSLNGSEKFVLRVDGKPFYATEIQVRPDKTIGYEGWSIAETEALFKQAAADGFSTLSVPIFWSEVELEKNHFDWNVLDRYMGWCKKYGMKMEILWFSWSSGGRIQYLFNTQGKKKLRTPDYVCSIDGKSEYNMLRNTWEYSLDWRDTNLRDRETYVLSRIMDHVALWDANNGSPHTVIGVQLGNEARAHGNNSASAAEIIDWYHNVGSAVKKSNYVVWTRLNCVSWETWGRIEANEKKKENGGSNIDFVGVDVYGTNAGNVKGNLSGWLGTYKKNYRMIMEIDAKDGNSPIYQMAALAGDKAYDYYNMGPVDGNGLYGNNGHSLAQRSHINLVRQRNTIINADPVDIALKKQGSGLYVYNYAGNSTSLEKGILSISYTPANDKSQAIAINRSDYEVVLMSTGGGKFNYPADLDIKSAERGYFDKANRWVKTGDITFSATTITLPEATCVRMLRGNDPNEGKLLLNGEFESNLNHWTKTFDASTYKVSTAKKGDGSVIEGTQGHMQVWNPSGITGKIYQDISLPNGTYTLRAGLYCQFGGSLALYANNDRVEIENEVNKYYEVNATVTDGHLQVGLDLKTSGLTDIEFDHVTLTEYVPTSIQGITHDVSSKLNDEAYYTLSGQRTNFPTRGIYIHKGEKIIIK